MRGLTRRGRARERQRSFTWRTWGGRRAGAGRKPAPGNVGLQPHVARPAFSPRVPAHVTMRVVPGASSLRGERVSKLVLRELSRASTRGLRLLHYSVQRDHLHVIVEADDGGALSRGMQRLASRIAMGFNARLGRRGRLWRERYHRRDLTTPRQFRNALVYVAFNSKKHGGVPARSAEIDPLSSAAWLEAWAHPDVLAQANGARAGPRPVARARSWIARRGWMRHGLLDACESPIVSG